FMQEHADPRCRPFDDAFDPLFTFMHDVPRDVAEESGAHVRDQSGTPFEKVWPLDRWPDVPTKVLLGREDRFFPPEFLGPVSRERLGVVPDEMPGGHLVALSRPKELAERLEKYRADLLLDDVFRGSE
ncbi:MAG TPA: alpha/beta fold hydrolase, partial [Actinomycetota bacterium]|nr:alpha/beta fold hydrolase [Actinomycetota bacterium]